MIKELLMAGIGMLALSASAQTNYLASDSVAVFVPANYEASQHLPSPIFKRELAPTAPVPSRWRLTPVFGNANGRSTASIQVGDADLYGCGETYGGLRLNGETIGFYNKDNGAYAAEGGKRLYQSHPWVLGVRKDGTAFGIIADNTWRSKVTLNTAVTFESEGPAFRIVVIERQNPTDVLKELAALSGTIELPPLWALGYQQSRFSYVPDKRALEVGETFRKENIPCDVVWMDIDYMDGFRIFTFDPAKYPNPKEFNDKMHANKFKTVFMIDPAPKADSSYSVFQQASAYDYWVKDKYGKPYFGKMWPGKCAWPDFTRPDVRLWWSGLYKDFMANGIDGIWNDVNEPQNSEGADGTLPDDCMHGGGDGLAPGPHLRYHNLYAYYMVKATREGIRHANPAKRPFVLSRANFLGGQRYAATWTGDNFSSDDHMRHSIPMTLNMGLTCQVFNGADIGGFLGDCTPDLLAKWTAIGIYFPFARNHSCEGTKDQEPWAMGKATENVCRTAINRRYRLLPYYYTLFEEASENGLPIMRPVFMADVNDLDLRSEDQAFTIGRDLLVVPRWAKNAKLPKGNWQEFRMESVDDGFQATLKLREGAALPLANLYQNTVDYKSDSLTVVINPDADGNALGYLYEDDGDGYGYKNGDFAKYMIKVSRKGKNAKVALVKVAGNRTGGNHWIRLAAIKKGKLVYYPWEKTDATSL